MAATWLPSSALPPRLYEEQDAICGAMLGGGGFIQGHPSVSLVKAVPGACFLERGLLPADFCSLPADSQCSLKPYGAEGMGRAKSGKWCVGKALGVGVRGGQLGSVGQVLGLVVGASGHRQAGQILVSLTSLSSCCPQRFPSGFGPRRLCQGGRQEFVLAGQPHDL